MPRFPVVLAACALTVSACSAGATAKPTAPPKPAGCKPVPRELLDFIATEASPNVAGLKLTAGAALPADPPAQAYLIAARVSAPGVDEVGVWASARLEPGQSPMYGVDETSLTYTKWPSAEAHGVRVVMADPKVEYARECL